ncbi:hypothetical protein EAI_09098 [Harpegnathos saltator]|uniref:Uncharacterized protein n=1 Tax=Harpegnathos saltator TaxID=610380 RepID=E2B7K9_HARSA|nr:hypothetical protein EAI_09098 [Harpegnathos saltator]
MVCGQILDKFVRYMGKHTSHHIVLNLYLNGFELSTPAISRTLTINYEDCNPPQRYRFNEALDRQLNRFVHHAIEHAKDYFALFLKTVLLLEGTSDSGKSEFVSEVLRPIFSSVLSGTLSKATLRQGRGRYSPGADINPECAKRRLLTTLNVFNAFRNMTEVTDKLMLRFVDYWYSYVDDATCSLRNLSVTDFTNVIRNRRVDASLGHACYMCMTQFLCINSIGKLCPKLHQMQSSRLYESKEFTETASAIAKRSTERVHKRNGTSLKRKRPSATAMSSSVVAPMNESVNDARFSR